MFLLPRRINNTMRTTKYKTIIYAFFLFIVSLTSTLATSADTEKTDLAITIFESGKPADEGTISIGDSKNWMVPVNKLRGMTDTRKVRVMPGIYKQPNDAMHITWQNCCKTGTLAIFGKMINIANLRNTHALAFAAKVHKKPTLSVSLGMHCEFPCTGRYEIRKQFRDAEPETWTTFSVPLSCFEGQNFDLSKINASFTMETPGILDISIADIRIEKRQTDNCQ